MDILLIEDNPADARMVDILLGERLGATYKLSHCTSLGDAITLLHEYEFDAALLDLNLPDGAGIEAFDKIHQINEALPVVVLTGQEDDEVSRTLIRAGAQGYLSKNTLTAELLERTLIYSIERQQLHSELSRKHLDTRRAEERFRTLIQSNADAILVVTPEQTICFANPAAEELFETCSSELLGTPFNQSLHTGQNFEMTLGSSEQELTTLDARVASIDWDGQLCSLVTLRNITRRKTLEHKVAREKAFLQSVVDGVMDPIMVTDINCKLRLQNLATSQLLGNRSPETQWPLRCYNSDQDRTKGCTSSTHCPLATVRHTGRPALTTQELKLKDQPVRYFEVQASPLRDGKGEIQGVIEASRDITDRVMMESKLRKNQEKMKAIALHDSLTGLPNRLLFKDRLHHSIVQARRRNKMLALLFMDLDRFKNINDSLGHSFGDIYLKEIAARLSGCVRESDTVARLGGDEFVILLEDIDSLQTVAKVAESFLANLSRPLLLEQQEFYPSASIGISTFPADADNPDDLMKCSDSAMYLAKEKGRGNYQFFTTDLKTRADKMLTLESALRQAIETDQLRLHYQPQYNMDTGKIVGLEALVRWKHPEKGLISPADFIPVAEETGLIIPLGQWVLNKACHEHQSWLSNGMPSISIAVNISPRQFHHGQILNTVKNALTQSGLAAEHLELEITESSIMYDANHAIEVMNQLRDLGVSLAIDDFGAGYSSLLRLKDFPISKIKIDQGFIRTLGEKNNTNAITRAIISLADNLRLDVIAEGVETELQASMLRNKGCQVAQGYLFSKPQPARLIFDMLKSYMPTFTAPQTMAETTAVS